MTTAFLPMLLDLDVQRHKRELAAAFAKLRESLGLNVRIGSGYGYPITLKGGAGGAGVGYGCVIITGGGGGAGSIGNTPPRPASGHDGTLLAGTYFQPTRPERGM